MIEKHLFDLARALAGEELVTRDGRPVTGFKLDTTDPDLCDAIITNDGTRTFWRDTGRGHKHIDNPTDLFMRHPAATDIPVGWRELRDDEKNGQEIWDAMFATKYAKSPKWVYNSLTNKRVPLNAFKELRIIVPITAPANPITPTDKWADLKAKHAKGARIEVNTYADQWVFADNPMFLEGSNYRLAPGQPEFESAEVHVDESDKLKDDENADRRNECVADQPYEWTLPSMNEWQHSSIGFEAKYVTGAPWKGYKFRPVRKEESAPKEPEKTPDHLATLPYGYRLLRDDERGDTPHPEAQYWCPLAEMWAKRRAHKPYDKDHTYAIPEQPAKFVPRVGDKVEKRHAKLCPDWDDYMGGHPIGSGAADHAKYCTVNGWEFRLAEDKKEEAWFPKEQGTKFEYRDSPTAEWQQSQRQICRDSTYQELLSNGYQFRPLQPTEPKIHLTGTTAGEPVKGPSIQSPIEPKQPNEENTMNTTAIESAKTIIPGTRYHIGHYGKVKIVGADEKAVTFCYGCIPFFKKTETQSRGSWDGTYKNELPSKRREKAMKYIATHDTGSGAELVYVGRGYEKPRQAWPIRALKYTGKKVGIFTWRTVAYNLVGMGLKASWPFVIGFLAWAWLQISGYLAK